LWELLLSAQDSVSGIPGQFLEQKKEEIKKRMVSLFTSIV
jgi:serine/arginine repetitive matrix protein 1